MLQISRMIKLIFTNKFVNNNLPRDIKYLELITLVFLNASKLI